MPSRILLVDDEDSVLTAWEQSLAPLRHQLFKARNEIQAIELSVEHPFDLVIIDYLIPPRTGVEILASIRKKLPLIKSIFVSAKLDKNASEQQIKEMVRDKVEVDEYLHKPVRPKILRETVTRLLTGSGVDWKELAAKSRTAQNVSPKDTEEVNSKLRQYLKKL